MIQGGLFLDEVNKRESNPELKPGISIVLYASDEGKPAIEEEAGGILI